MTFKTTPKPKVEALNEYCSEHTNQRLLSRTVYVYDEVTKTKQPKNISVCLECARENRDNRVAEAIERNKTSSELFSTYAVLMRDSTMPAELKNATFDNYKAETQDEVALLEFFKEQTRKYWNDMKGNTLITGSTGIGKSHLSVAMAKLLNEQYKKIGKPKSFLFVNMTEIIKQIKAGWADNSGQAITESQVVKRLTEVDFLILDDLGAQNSVVKPKSDWEQDLMFDILDKRERTIINTNLSSDELKTAYNARNFSRMLKGSNGNIFKAGNIEDKREEL